MAPRVLASVWFFHTDYLGPHQSLSVCKIGRRQLEWQCCSWWVQCGFQSNRWNCATKERSSWRNVLCSGRSLSFQNGWWPHRDRIWGLRGWIVARGRMVPCQDPWLGKWCDPQSSRLRPCSKLWNDWKRRWELEVLCKLPSFWMHLSAACSCYSTILL